MCILEKADISRDLLKGNSGEGSERKEAVEKAFVFLENTYNHVQNVGRRTNSKGHSDGVSDRNEKHAIGQQSCLCYKVAKNLTELCSCSSVL